MDQLMDSHRGLLGKFAGPVPISVNSSLWLELLAFPGGLQLLELGPAHLLAALQPYCQQLALNDLRTGHYAKLMYHVVQQLQSCWSPQALDVIAVTNSVLFLQNVTIHLASILRGRELQSLFTTRVEETPRQDLLADLQRICFRYTQETPVQAQTYGLHWAVLRLLTALLSTQLYNSSMAVPGAHPAQEAMHAQPALSTPAVQTLLQIYIQQPRAPASLPLHKAEAAETSGELSKQRSMARTLSRAASDFVTLPLRMTQQLLWAPAASGSPLADSALHLLLLLLHTSAPQGHASHGTFRDALQALRNSEASISSDGRDSEPPAPAGPALPFSDLFTTITANLSDEGTLLLLYNLMNRCQPFLEALLVRSDIDAVFLPLLHHLYATRSSTPHHLYMLQIIVLMLTQDATLNRSLHKMRVERVPWYQERTLTNVDLGSLLFIILLRTAHHNLADLQDEHLQTNTLAALANLAPHTSHLSSQATHRLLLVMEACLKRLTRAESSASTNGTHGDGSQGGQAAPLVVDLLTSILDVLDTLIAYTLPKNPELVYSLLHQQEVLQRLAVLPAWRDRLASALAIVTQFNALIDAAQSDTLERSSSDWSAARVLRVIETNLATWAPPQHAAGPPHELQFMYEESASANDFFLPYIWSLIEKSPYLAFPIQAATPGGDTGSGHDAR